MIINAPYTPPPTPPFGGGEQALILEGEETTTATIPPEAKVITSPSCEEVALPRQTGESEGVKPEGLGA